MTFPIKLEGRFISEEDLSLMRRVISDSPQSTRADLSRTVCRELAWIHDDGRLKETRCRVAMLRLHEQGLLTLPTAKRNPQKKGRYLATVETDPGESINLPRKGLGNITIQVVSANNKKLSNKWNTYMDRYHYLGYRATAGHQVRYMISSEIGDLALFNFSSAAWKVGARDQWIGWDHETREKNLKYIINNSRFLILPWVRSKNLASWILGSIKRRVGSDWVNLYGYQPVLLETFVDITKFEGTCYKAANWKLLGLTEGRGKYDFKKERALSKKKIYVQPLIKNCNAILNGA
jgi:hypothetical protein